MAKTKNGRIDFENTDFFELLAHEADSGKQSLVINVLELVRKGDPSAIRLLEKALLTKASSDENKPIPILMGATQHQNALPSNNGAAPNIGSTPAA